MNNKLQEALTVFLTKSLDAVEKGVNMAGEQMPLVLHEIIQWEIWNSAIGFVIALIMSICLAFAISMINLYFLIKALTAPRLVIIEFLKGML